MTGNNQQSPVSPVVTIPGYKILEVLGKGGMAIVYLAIQESIGRNVALKILAPDHTDESFTDRFLREARIISQLTHPNIITIYDAGVHQGYHYMCMEYVPGQNLTQARDTLNRKQKIGIIKQIALALDYAGKKGYVHRDIKPENVMLHEDGRAILTDFGIARGQDITRGLTQTGKAVGTPYFMSPEQTKGLEVDHRSDIYSLGVVFFQAIAGYVPYDGPSIVAIGIKHISEPIPPLPAGMEIFQPIINKCMSKDPTHRYQTANELYQALDEISEAQLDYIEAKARALRQSATSHQAKTQINQPSVEILANSAVRPAASPAIPKMRALRNSMPVDITQTAEFKRLARRRRRWLLLVLLLVLAVAGYYQQDRLLQLWQQQLQPRLAPYLPAGWRTRANMAKGAGASTKITPAKAAIPISKPTPEPAAPASTTPASAATHEKTAQDILAAVQRDRNKLRLHPDDASAREDIAQARTWFRNKLEQALVHRDPDNARQILQMIHRSFPRAQRLPAFAHIEQRIAQIESFKSHLEQARVYMAANAVAKPAGANALQEYLAASRIYPNDPAVQNGLQRIAAYFYKKARAAETENNLVDAVDAVANGLQANAHDQQLLALKQELATIAKQQQQIKSMLQDAASLMRKNQVIAPADNNAYQLYRAVLKISPHNQDANNGLQQVQLWLLSKIQDQYDNKQYLPARKLTRTALRDFPNSKIFSTWRNKINRAIDANYPKITRIIFSARPVTSLTGQNNLDNLAPGKTLYAGFAFKNFYADNTRLIARLKNADDKTLYDEQAVNVSGRDGQGHFALHLPKPGSHDGNYSVELYMNKARILKARLSGLN
ncbi:MAG: protein kinase [Gammaproteobacteria bacterium]